jgi:hypothetical protein
MPLSWRHEIATSADGFFETQAKGLAFSFVLFITTLYLRSSVQLVGFTPLYSFSNLMFNLQGIPDSLKHMTKACSHDIAGKCLIPIG